MSLQDNIVQEDHLWKMWKIKSFFSRNEHMYLPAHICHNYMI